MKYYLFLKYELQLTSGRDPTVTEVAELVAEKVETIWKKASIPIVSHTRVLQMLRAFHDMYRKLLKPYKGRQNNSNYKKKLTDFAKRNESKLFDIAICKCSLSACSCQQVFKVPAEERDFLEDQRTVRLMYIGRVDIAMSKKKLKRMSRKAAAAAFQLRHTQITEESTQGQVNFSETSASENEDQDSKSESFSASAKMTQSTPVSHRTPVSQSTPETLLSSKPQKQMRLKLPNLAQICDRFGVSDRAGAAVATSVLQDVGLITEEDSSSIVDRNKLRRERKRKRIEVIKTKDNLQGLFFDGRKDKTLVIEQVESKTYRKTVTEEHVVLVHEPGSEYIGHIAPRSSTAADIVQSMTEYFDENSINLGTLVAVGCDGTATNTGCKGGAIRLIEKKINKPVQWLVCQLHANELPLRHLFTHLDGPTTGPRGFSGPIGKALQACETLPIVAFEKIESNFPYITCDDLSTDQAYLLDISQAVITGNCSNDLARRDPGKLNHSRWLTTANRILRLYVATTSPSAELKEMAMFIVKVYAPLWFLIKTKPSCKDGARHLWKTVSLSRYLPQKLKKVVDPVIQRNGYFAHPENLLLAVITDENPNMRELGIRRFLKSRQSKATRIRKFEIPKLNFQASNYIDLINWQKVALTPPPILSAYSNAEVEQLIKDGDQSALKFDRFPCHTQAVERCVKLVTEASSAVCGQQSRDGFIRSRIESRMKMPCFNSKKDYKI